MKSGSADRRAFIGYPTNRVVGTIRDADRAGDAIAALLRAGFNREDIDILHGEQDLERLSPSGPGVGLLAQFQRSVIETFELEEFRHLTHHIDDVRAGRFVIMVMAKRRAARIVAADILHHHGAEFVGFYGRWAWADLPPTGEASPADVPALFARAWNARDADALASLFDEDAEFVNGSGLIWQNRESIRTEHATRLKGAAAVATLAPADIRVKLLAPEVAVVHSRMTHSDGAPAGTATPPLSRTSLVSFVVHRAGDRWLCASAHSTDAVADQA